MIIITCIGRSTVSFFPIFFIFFSLYRHRQTHIHTHTYIVACLSLPFLLFASRALFLFPSLFSCSHFPISSLFFNLINWHISLSFLFIGRLFLINELRGRVYPCHPHRGNKNVVESDQSERSFSSVGRSMRNSTVPTCIFAVTLEDPTQLLGSRKMPFVYTISMLYDVITWHF